MSFLFLAWPLQMTFFSRTLVLWIAYPTYSRYLRGGITYVTKENECALVKEVDFYLFKVIYL